MKRCFTTLLCLLLAATAIFTTSCAMKIQATELSAGYTRTTTDPGEVTDAYLAATLDFSLKLFRETVTEDETNDLFSPYSALLCLGLVANGTAGTTREQIETVLGLSVEELNRGLYAFNQGLYSAKDCKVTTANSIWFRNTFTVDPTYLQTVADWYDAEQYATPFDKTTLQDINNWSKEKTERRIPKVLDEASPGIVMYLINTLLFDAKWQEPYEKSQLVPRSFTNADGTKARVTMLSSEEDVYLESDTAIGFAKPYQGGQYDFIGLLPKGNQTVSDVVKELNGAAWRQIWQSRLNNGCVVDVTFPRFSHENKTDLIAPLTALGIDEMFGNHADFSSINASASLSCSFFQQLNTIQVNPNGTVAASATIGGLESGIKPVTPHYTVTLDRPFLYAIIEHKTGFPLYIGTVNDLSADVASDMQ